MERWCVIRYLALLYPASIHPLSMESAVLSASVSLVRLQLWFRVENVCWDPHNLIPTVHVCVCVYIKIMKTAGPRGLSGPIVRSPVDVEGSRGADPATASSRPAPARQSRPAAACWWSVTARVGHHSACLICLNLFFCDWLAGPKEQIEHSAKERKKKYGTWDKCISEIGIIIGNMLLYTQHGAVVVVCVEFYFSRLLRKKKSLYYRYVLVSCLARPDGNWGLWSPWSACTTTCGDGSITRVRLCNNPPPQKGGRGCTGNDRDTQPCNNTLCPSEYTNAHTDCTVAGSQLNDVFVCSSWRLDELEWVVPVLRVVRWRSYESPAGVFEPSPSARREALCWRHCGLWSV